MQEYRTIHLPQGNVAIVDAADYEWLSQWKWGIGPSNGGIYAQRIEYVPAKRRIKMHRLILGILDDPSIQADHINGNTLDNRRSNLRKATRNQNMCNRKSTTPNKIGMRGVDKCGGKYRAQIRFEGKKIHLGIFPTPELAHTAYREAAMRLHGNFANFTTKEQSNG